MMTTTWGSTALALQSFVSGRAYEGEGEKSLLEVRTTAVVRHCLTLLLTMKYTLTAEQYKCNLLRDC